VRWGSTAPQTIVQLSGPAARAPGLAAAPVRRLERHWRRPHRSAIARADRLSNFLHWRLAARGCLLRHFFHSVGAPGASRYPPISNYFFPFMKSHTMTSPVKRGFQSGKTGNAVRASVSRTTRALIVNRNQHNAPPRWGRFRHPLQFFRIPPPHPAQPNTDTRVDQWRAVPARGPGSA